MKLTLERSELWRGLQTVQDAVAGKPSMPVLGNILLEADGQRLSMTATDMDMSLRTSVAAEVTTPGRTTVPAKTLSQIVREWQADGLSITVEDSKCILASKQGRYTLPTAGAAEFPEIPESIDGLSMPCGEGARIDGVLLRRMIDKTSFAASHDDTRPVLKGVAWHVDAGWMSMAATDGSRLAEFRKRWEDGDERVPPGVPVADVILPPQTCSQLLKLLDGEETLDEVTLGESQVLFQVGGTQLLSRLIEGPYVDYRQVMPPNNDKRITVAVAELLPAVRRVSVLSSSYTHQVRLHAAGDDLVLETSSQEIGGDAREVVQCDYSEQEEEFRAAYNAVYLIELLRKLDSEEVVLEVSDTVTAAILRPATTEDGESATYLLMPMRPSA